jgi:hypothetical protein
MSRSSAMWRNGRSERVFGTPETLSIVFNAQEPVW